MVNVIEQFDNYFDVENARLQSDRNELEQISNALPRDGVLSTVDCIKLEWKILRGMNICDFWIPKIHIMTSEKESERDKIRNNAYANASSKDSHKLTVEMRKVISELDENLEKAKIEVEKLKAIKLFLEKKRDSFKSALFIFKEQIQSFRSSDGGVNSTAFAKDDDFNDWVK